MSAEDVRAGPAEAAAALRVLLDENNAGHLSCSAAFRHRAEGAVVALGAMTGSVPSALEALREGAV